MLEEMLELLTERKISALAARLRDTNPADIALLLERVPFENLPIMYRILPKELAAETFVEMEPDSQEALIRSFSDEELRETVEQLFLDDTVDIIEEMPATVVKRIIKAADPVTRKQINELLKYPQDSAGSIMTIEFADLKKDMTVSEAFNRIRRIGPDKETIYTCYVTDNNRCLLGVITAKELMLAEQNCIIGDIMEKNVIFVYTKDDREFAVKQIEKYDLLAIPVVDDEERLVGIVTVDDAIDVIQEEAEEDFAKMAAMTPIEDNYFKTSVFSHSKKRIFWLIILMLSSNITGRILAAYENAFAAIPILVSFIPMIMNTGGNCGSQSSTMVIRGLAVGELSLRDFFRVLFKEMRIGICVGTVLAIVNSLLVYALHRDLKLALVLTISIVVAAIIAKSLGCIMPMLAKLLKLDPALIASPLITTIVDCLTVFIYFNVATGIMNLQI